MSSAQQRPMRLVMINRFYWPDTAATAQMLQDLAEDLAAAGHDVQVIASRGSYADGRARLPREELHNGVRIRRVGGTSFGRRTALGRVLDYASFLAAATWQLLIAGGRDIVTMTDPPLSFALALGVARLRGARVIHWVQDIYPAIAVRLGVLGENGGINRLYRLASPGLHRRCHLTIALGPLMADTLEREGVPRARLAVSDNWADAQAIKPVSRDENAFVREYQLKDKFVVLYSGNAGRGHEFAAVTGAMARLRDETDIHFVFIGGGAKMAELKQASEAHALRNVTFLDYFPRHRLAETLSAADVSLVTEDPRVAGLLVPSKTYGILASGRPIVFLGSPESDVARIVNENNAGVVLDPFDDEGLVSALKSFIADRRAAEAMGINARAAAQQKYDRRLATRRWASLVESVLS